MCLIVYYLNLVYKCVWYGSIRFVEFEILNSKETPMKPIIMNKLFFLCLSFVAAQIASPPSEAKSSTRPSIGYVQSMPDCETLSSLWLSRYHSLLKVKIPLKALSCIQTTAQKGWVTGRKKALKSKSDPFAQMSLALARGAYLLDATVFQPGPFYGLSSKTLVRPPASMLEWISARLRGGIVMNYDVDYPYAILETGTIHFPITLETGDAIEIAGQLIHESRHINFPPIYHVECQSGAGLACDESLTSWINSPTAGPHAVAALWLSWIAKRSYWEPEITNRAEAVVRWVVENRVHNSYMEKQEWLKRYLSDVEPLFKHRPVRFQQPLKTQH